jgi:hypothetical protein
MGYRRGLAILIAGVAGVLLVSSGPASAATASKCTAAKLKCAAKKECGLLGCHSKAETKGVAVDPACTTKAQTSFPGCFTKAESKPPCNAPTGDAAVLENKIDAFVLDVVQEVDPGYPTPIANKCSAAKKKCACKKASYKLGCYSKSTNKGILVDPACLAKAEAAFVKCFNKAETKVPCLTTGDAAAIEAKIDAFVEDVRTELGGSPSGAFLD